jgi:multidrug efflux system membrane fusion protein
LKWNYKLALLGTLTCLPLVSCTRVSAKADPAAADLIPVRVDRAVSQDVPLEISAVGNVQAINSVEVKSRIAGQIERVNFTEGQSVAKGQLLFTIDRTHTSRAHFPARCATLYSMTRSLRPHKVDHAID